MRKDHIRSKLVLVLAKTDLATKKKDGKEYLIRVNDINGDKIILIILVKIVILYIKFSMIEVQELGFEWTFLRAWFWATYFHLEKQIYVKFCDFLKNFLVY